MRFVLILMFFSISLVMAEDIETRVGDEVAISVQNQSIYPMPAFYASPVESVNYGTIALIDEIEGEWYRITTSLNQAGWIHCTSVTGAIQTASSGTSATGDITSDEIMLAGRGFNQEIEDKYAGNHPELNFILVDNMETSWTVSPEQLYQFLISGNLIEDIGSTTPDPSPSTGRGSGR